MNIPQITDLDVALHIYYRYPEIGSKEIQLLFHRHSKSTISRLKKLAKRKMTEDGIYTHGLYKLNTVSAYEAWGIDVKDLEARRSKLQKLGL